MKKYHALCFTTPYAFSFSLSTGCPRPCQPAGMGDSRSRWKAVAANNSTFSSAESRRLQTSVSHTQPVSCEVVFLLAMILRYPLPTVQCTPSTASTTSARSPISCSTSSWPRASPTWNAQPRCSSRYMHRRPARTLAYPRRTKPCPTVYSAKYSRWSSGSLPTQRASPRQPR